MIGDQRDPLLLQVDTREREVFQGLVERHAAPEHRFRLERVTLPVGDFTEARFASGKCDKIHIVQLQRSDLVGRQNSVILIGECRFVRAGKHQSGPHSRTGKGR